MPTPTYNNLSCRHTENERAALSPRRWSYFNRLTESFPNYAEGWNKRATLHYVLGNLDASDSDIEKTLALEPRHFGALSGLGMVYIQRKELSKAKQAFEDLIEVHPNSPMRNRIWRWLSKLRFSVI